MPRPNRRRCGRVTPKETRPGDRPRESPVEEPQLEELVLQDAAEGWDCC